MSKVTKFFRGKVRSLDATTHTAEVVISNEGLDRYKERVLVKAFKKTIKDFMEHPVLLSSHAYRGLMSQIGEFTKIKIDEETKEVIAYPKWYVNEGNPEADWGWKLAEKGIAAFSIGFIPKKWVDHDTDEMRAEAGGSRRSYEEIELLETSQVLIPALRTALQRSFDSEDEEIRQLAADILEAMKEDFPEETPTDTKEEIKEVTEEAQPNKTTDQRLQEMELQLGSMNLMLVDVKAYLLTLVEGKEIEPSTTITAAEGIVSDPMLAEVKAKVDELLSKFAPPEKKDPPPENTEDAGGEKDAATEIDDLVENVLSEEKLLELEESLRRSLSGDKGIDIKSVKTLLDDMTEEISRTFSSQPKGNG